MTSKKNQDNTCLILYSKGTIKKLLLNILFSQLILYKPFFHVSVYKFRVSVERLKSLYIHSSVKSFSFLQKKPKKLAKNICKDHLDLIIKMLTLGISILVFGPKKTSSKSCKTFKLLKCRHTIYYWKFLKLPQYYLKLYGLNN